MTAPLPAVSEAIVAFCDALGNSFSQGQFLSAVLAKYRGAQADLDRIDLRRVQVKHQPMLQFVYHHTTRDITHNHPLHEGVALVQSLLGSDGFRNAHLHTAVGTQELLITKRGQATLRQRVGAVRALPGVADDALSLAPTLHAVASAPVAAGAASHVAENHNREKQRMLSVDRPFLMALGVTAPAPSSARQRGPAHERPDAARVVVVPAMARKWKQINKFIEVFASALAASGLASSTRLNVVDFGSGKGYLTFAVHDWLTHVKGIDAQVTGVELRPDLVSLCQAVIQKLHLQGLHVEQGDVTQWQPAAMNVMIALHACDTATDHAIDLGLRGGADIILCSPCCHKQLRPQLLSPHPLRPILQHGVHLGQEAEMLTDGLRALLLEAAGYDTQVFEFISLEHTNKNKMILAVKSAVVRSPKPVLEQIAEIKAFYGIREQCLEMLIAGRSAHGADNRA